MSDITIIARCEAKGLRMTGQRRTIASVLEEADDHPDVEELHSRAAARDAGISIATVYRTVKLFEEAGILDKLEFGDGRARYEDAEREPDRRCRTEGFVRKMAVKPDRNTQNGQRIKKGQQADFENSDPILQ